MSDTSNMSSLTTLYNTVFALIEEELFQRLHPESYQDKPLHHQSRVSKCDLSNPDINLFRLDLTPAELDDIQNGGNNNVAKESMFNEQTNITNTTNSVGRLIPGKFDIIRNSYNVPLNVAIKGTIQRQQLFLKEKRH